MQKPPFLPKKLLWVDMEMTGLDPQNDRITEIAAIVTDWDFTELGIFESGVGHDEAVVKSRIAQNPMFATMPGYTDDILSLVKSSPAQHEVERQLLAFVDTHFSADEPVLLAGNSIHQDRQFIRRWWPNLERRLHYRMLDVSAWKVVMMGKYNLEFKKTEAHRALGDIRESMAELKFYLEKVSL